MGIDTQHLVLGIVVAILGILETTYKRAFDRELVELRSRLSRCEEKCAELSSILRARGYD